MDFAALMGKALTKDKASSSTTATTTVPKYQRKSDAEAARREAYLAEQAAQAEARAAKAAAKRKREDEIATETKARDEKRRRLGEESRRLREEKEAEEERARRKRLGLPEVPLDSAADAAAEETSDDEDDGDEVQAEVAKLSNDEIIAKLRSLKEPITLYGEDEAGRRKRYLALVRKALIATQSGPIPTTLRLVPEKDMRVDGTVPTDKHGRKFLFRQLASYFSMILTEWEAALAKESQETFAGKAAYSAMVQSKETMRPLFRKFEKGDLDSDILQPVVDIVKAAQERRYVDANDDYLRLSIGKAAWPIGVTMVGIHERSAREKLHNGERGHVMGDEVTRKYLQSIKRCLTFAQTRWPPDDVRQLMG